MVHKLPLQPDPLKRKGLLQLHDSKITAVAPPDLKKKMKKSGSIKQSPVNSTARTPNYMKSTTSSDARKEQSQVSSPNCSRSRTKGLDIMKNANLESGKRCTKTLARMRSLTKNPSFKLSRKCSPVVLCENFDAQRATCSSTLKDRKFPAYLPLNRGGTEAEGTSAMKVCPYTYCSLNGHHRSPLPPLKCFLSAKRRMLKVQRGIKLGCLSPRRLKTIEDFDQKLSPKVSPVCDDEEGMDFFIEIFSRKGDDEEVQVVKKISDACKKPDDMDWETGHHSVLDLDYDYECSEIEAESNLVVESEIMAAALINESDNKSDEVLVDELSLVSFNGELFNSDGFFGSDDCKFDGWVDNVLSFDNIENSAPVEGSSYLQNEDAVAETGDTATNNVISNQSSISNEDQTGNTECLDENLMDIAKEPNLGVKKPNEGNAPKPEAEDKDNDGDSAVGRSTAKCQKNPMEESDELGAFNPRGPNFLPLEPDPEAEKVDLRHQELDGRKNTEEWMVDYALRQTVTKLGLSRKRKVALLVEAFEKVMPITKCELPSAFDHARPIQACM